MTSFNTFNTSGRENKFQDEYLAALRSYGAYAISVVGGVYQSGQPDLSCVSTHGQETKIELKVYRAISVPTREKVLQLLKGPQRNVIINQLFRRNANCLIIAQIGAVPSDCAVLSREKFSIAKVIDTAKLIARLEWGQYTPYQ
jgi:hypothetical protein